jgi:DNA-directed RNA polymerase specialized sigma24 family protein
MGPLVQTGSQEILSNSHGRRQILNAMTEPEPILAAAEDQFLRLFVQAEPALLRAIMSLVPNQADARDVLQETAAVLWG